MDSKVKEYIDKQKPADKKTINNLRKLIKKTFPGISEEYMWGVIGYDGGRYYVAALKNQVNLGFAIKGLSPEEVKLFEGSGKTMRHIKIHTENLDEEKLVKLLKLVKKKAVCQSC